MSLPLFCRVCGAQATVRDMEHDRYFCDEHAAEIENEPHERLYEEVGWMAGKKRPWEITLKFTMGCYDVEDAQVMADEMLEHLLGQKGADWTGATGVVLELRRVEP